MDRWQTNDRQLILIRLKRKTSGKSHPRGVKRFGKHRTSPHQKLSQDTCRASTANQGPILCPNWGCTKKCHRMRATNLSSSPAPTFALDSPAIRNFNFGWSEVQHHKVLPCTKWFWALRRRGLHRCALRPLLCRWALCRCALRLWRALQNLHTLCYVPELIVWLSCPWITWWYCLWLLLLPAQSRTPVTQKPYNNVHSCLCAKDERKVRFNNIVISSQKSKDTVPAGGWSHELALKHSTETLAYQSENVCRRTASANFKQIWWRQLLQHIWWDIQEYLYFRTPKVWQCLFGHFDTSTSNVHNLAIPLN